MNKIASKPFTHTFLSQFVFIQKLLPFSDDEIKKMVKDAEAHASDDKKRKEMIEARNRAESLIHEAEKSLREHEKVIKPGDKTAIEEAVKATRDALAAENKDVIEEKTQTLTQAMMKIGEDIYKAQQASGDASASSGEGSKGADGDVLDAHYEEVKDDKKE